MDSNNYFSVNSQLKIPLSPVGEYICNVPLCLYDNENCESVATQAKKGRQLKILNPPNIGKSAMEICLCEDQYIAWLPLDNISFLKPAQKAYQNIRIYRKEIERKIPNIINFTLEAMKVPNFYLWGGTVTPNYDCSGLIQDSFANLGIWLPRDSYQQERFVTKINQDQLQKGDLIFFGKEKVTHVALYLGDNSYIHSSGEDIGNNGIGINYLSPDLDQVSANYYQILWGFGRVDQSF